MNSDWIKNSISRFASLSGERIETIDMHTAGEPLRIILSAPFFPAGESLLARRHAAQTGDWDRFRRALMYEPRGHQDMYGAIIVPPMSANADFGVLFTHNEGYSTMCGHAVIALGKAAVELGWVEKEEPETIVHIDAPAGLVTVHARIHEGRVKSIWFENVPSFVVGLDQKVQVPSLGLINYDLAYGGAFYAFVDSTSIGLELAANNSRMIASTGMAIKHAVMNAVSIEHPEEADLSFLYGTIFTGPGGKSSIHSRHACVFADGAVDRSPTGTGVSARMALLHSRNRVTIKECVRIDSLTGEEFFGRVSRLTSYHGRPAVIPEVEGTASFTGRHTFVIEPDDPLKTGFLLR